MSSDSLAITRAGVGRRVALEAGELERQLVALERAGFVDARRLRLTMTGLAAAVAMQSSRPRRAQVTQVAA